MESSGVADTLAVRGRATAIERLQREFAGVLSPETVARAVAETFDDVALRSSVPRWVPLLGERLAGERLRAAAVLAEDRSGRRPQVLFVCEHNAGRSQLAAALATAIAGEAVGVWSAGEAPAHEIDPQVQLQLAEIGVDVRAAFPKPLLDEVVAAADVIVTMGCGDACPVIAGKRYLDWQVPDPAGADAHAVRQVRLDLEVRVRALLLELVPSL